MPQGNSKVSPDQRVAAMAWVAACEKLDHFLRGTHGYPELSSNEVTLKLDVAESAFLDLRTALHDGLQSAEQ